MPKSSADSGFAVIDPWGRALRAIRRWWLFERCGWRWVLAWKYGVSIYLLYVGWVVVTPVRLGTFKWSTIERMED